MRIKCQITNEFSITKAQLKNFGFVINLDFVIWDLSLVGVSL